MGVSPYSILSLYLRLLIRMEWECVMLSWVPWRRSTSMRRARRTTVTATERCHYHPISCQQNYETLFFTDNIQCVIWPGPHSNWLEAGDRERQSRGEKVQIHKYIKPRNSIYRNYKVAALEATMCSTVPLEDLYKRRWSVVSATFQCISIYFSCVCYISTIPKGVEGQEAGCPGQVEEGHGEGGGRQQLVERRQEVTRPWNYWSEVMTRIPFIQILKRTMEWIDLME